MRERTYLSFYPPFLFVSWMRVRAFFFFFCSWRKTAERRGERVRVQWLEDWSLRTPSHIPAPKTQSLLSERVAVFRCPKSFLGIAGVGKEACSE